MDVAFRLLEHIAAAEGKTLISGARRPGEILASRQWLLDTYTQCLRSVNVASGMTRAGQFRSPAAAQGEILPSGSALPEQPLAQWISDHCKSEAYKIRVSALGAAAGSLMSPPDEVALICGLIEHLRPALAVEIGTFFGQTARPMAGALSRYGGKLITIDPYGGHRVPGIIADWPEPLRDATDFHPIFSMELFARIEEKLFAVEAPPKIGLAFVDGNHKFEYAFFDMMEAGENLVPGGAIVVDNLEQQGPRFALLQFLRLNPAWQFYYRGKIWSGPISARDLDPPTDAAVEWGVLIAPAHIAIAMKGRKFSGRLTQTEVISGLRLNLRGTAGASVDMRINLLYYAEPLDYHLSGKGIVGLRREALIAIKPGLDVIDVTFDPPGRLPPHSLPVNVKYQLETAVADEDAYVLLDAERPFEFMFAPSGDHQTGG